MTPDWNLCVSQFASNDVGYSVYGDVVWTPESSVVLPVSRDDKFDSKIAASDNAAAVVVDNDCCGDQYGCFNSQMRDCTCDTSTGGDSWCCDTYWDPTCIELAQEKCGLTCGGSGGGSGKTLASPTASIPFNPSAGTTVSTGKTPAAGPAPTFAAPTPSPPTPPAPTLLPPTTPAPAPTAAASLIKPPPPPVPAPTAPPTTAAVPIKTLPIIGTPTATATAINHTCCKQDNTCPEMMLAVCACDTGKGGDFYCCSTYWDDQCVAYAQKNCGLSCPAATASSNSKTLASGNLAPPPPPGTLSSATSTSTTSSKKNHVCCANQAQCSDDAMTACVCNPNGGDALCCTDKWDSVCVGFAQFKCGLTCVASAAAGTESALVVPFATSLLLLAEANYKNFVPAPLIGDCCSRTHECGYSNVAKCVCSGAGGDPYCCSAFWDELCIGRAQLACRLSCSPLNANTKVALAAAPILLPSKLTYNPTYGPTLKPTYRPTDKPSTKPPSISTKEPTSYSQPEKNSFFDFVDAYSSLNGNGFPGLYDQYEEQDPSWWQNADTSAYVALG